ncbi:MAG: ATP-dependent zinc metalloprotease FtsH [Ruminococcaceae bacterium]|nr:ATP-dependent zinc metalloprotease FtsH [Oscillospiraceae bacterium]
MKKFFKSTLIYLVIFGIVLAACAVIWNDKAPENPSYGDVVTYFQNEDVRKFEIDKKNNLLMQVRTVNEDGTEGEDKLVEYRLRSLDLFYFDLGELILEQNKAGIIEDYDMPAPTEIPVWVGYLPYVLIIGVFIFLWWYMMNQATGGKGSKINSFGRAKAKLGANETKKVYFTDVAGAEEEKAELEEIVEFLKDPAKFTKLGAKIPHGVLLMGPPGTGKTLLAKAVAGEAGVPFYSISGSDFVEMYVGVGASRVRDLFETAKKTPAAIIFIDEIDAVGRHRGAGLGGGHDEREQTLNQLLVEMDGFGSNEGIIVMAATNRPDILDPALLRPGRFDRQITVGYPDIKGREEILKVHARNKHFEDDVSFETIAKTTAGFTGADLANLLNEAALLAARKDKSLIGMYEIEEARTKLIAGPQKKSMKIKENEKKKTAFHEAGHAIISHVLPDLDPVHTISIIPSGRALGYTLSLPEEDKYSVYKNELKQRIAMLLGGRAAEELVFEDISGGASNDIERATEIAHKMVTQLGMSEELGPIKFGQGQSEVFLGRDFSNGRNYSEEIASKIDSEIHRIISEAYENAKRTLSENMDKMTFIAEYLVKNEVMDGEQFKKVMEEDTTFEELDEMVAEKRRRSAEENERRRAVIEENERRREEERKKEEEAKKLEEARKNSPFGFDPPREDKNDGSDENE